MDNKNVTQIDGIDPPSWRPCAINSKRGTASGLKVFVPPYIPITPDTTSEELTMPFITEPVPRAFIDSFDSKRLRGEFGLGSMPDNPMFHWSIWTIDKERDATLITVDDNDMTRRSVDDTLPRRTWYALLWKGRVVSFETTTGAEDIEGEGAGIAPGTERSFEIKVWDDTDIWLDDDLIEQLPEVLVLTRDAYYVAREGAELPWIKGVEIRLRSVNDVAVDGVAS